ncbi:MAG: PspC domain-containing protein [Bacteroidales bacterium 43_36]|nr:MAG: PspC domain-containing protein [Bacteroidales bacterium 43_36]
MKRLYRSNTNRLIAGVCGGLGEYFRIDPVIIRIASFVLGVCGVGILAYILFWLFVPNNPDPNM